jgi:hypothetical protein
MLLIGLGKKRKQSVPQITLQPLDATIQSGNTVTFTVGATGGGLFYQWQRNLGTGLGWSNVAFTNSPSFTTPVLTASERKHAWRCRIHNSKGRVMSRVCTVAIRTAAATYYVDGVSGNDSNAGTSEGAAFATIAKAISMGSSVNILLRRGQTFTGAVVLSAQYLGAYGTGSAPILTHNATTTLQTTGGALIEDIETRNSSAGSATAAVVIAGPTRVRRCVLRSNGNKSITMSGTDCIVENCDVFDDMNCAQLATCFQSANGIIRNCNLTVTQSQTQLNVFVHGAGTIGNVIEDNLITRTVTDTSVTVTQGIGIFQDYTYVSDVIIRGNTIRGVGFDRAALAARSATAIGNIIDIRGSMTNNAPFEANRGATLTLRNNTIITDSATIYAVLASDTSAASNIIAQNNIVVTLSNSNFYTGISGVSTFTSNRNIYWGSSRAAAWNATNFATWQAAGRDVNGLNSNPLLMDLATNDYRIQASSPARNTGQDFDYELDHFGWEYDPTNPSMGALAYWEASA